MSAAKKVEKIEKHTVLNFYTFDGSIPCAIVLMTAKALQVTLHSIPINITADEHHTVHFKKINPQCTVPVLSDGLVRISESRAIMMYLVQKFDEKQVFYPSDPVIRAKINELLFFDNGTLYQHFADCYMRAITNNAPLKQESYNRVEADLGHLDEMLEGRNLAACDAFTIADIALLGTVAGLEAVGFNFEKRVHLLEWYRRAKDAGKPHGIEVSMEQIGHFKVMFPNYLFPPNPTIEKRLSN